MIYLDTSVALAQLLAEDHRPPDELWDEPLVSSRLMEYELWTRLHARALAGSHGDAARMLLARLGFLELARPVLARALEPFPTPVRTLDALHLASAMFLRERGHDLAIATYDARMNAAAMAMGLATFEL
jgi:predicted nucleic acid-binding protein